MKIARNRFLEMTQAAWSEIPPGFRERIVNLDMTVKNLPGPEAGRERGSRNLLGLYIGLSRSEMTSPEASGFMPARILLYQSNIMAGCRDEQELRKAIRTTLRHELAHHFGFSDADLRRVWPEGA